MERRLAEDFFAALRSEFEILVAAESSDAVSYTHLTLPTSNGV